MKTKWIKITLGDEDMQAAVWVPEGATASEVLEKFAKLMLVYSYQPASVQRAAEELAEEMGEEWKM